MSEYSKPDFIVDFWLRRGQEATRLMCESNAHNTQGADMVPPQITVSAEYVVQLARWLSAHTGPANVVPLDKRPRPGDKLGDGTVTGGDLPSTEDLSQRAIGDEGDLP